MALLSGFLSAEIAYDKNGAVTGGDAAALALANDPTVTDLLVLAHGWNDDAATARSRYAALATSLRDVIDQNQVPGLAGRTVGILQLLWPATRSGSLLLVPAGLPGADSAVTERDVLDEIDRIRPVFPDQDQQDSLDAAAARVPELVDKLDAQDAYVDALRGLLGDPEDRTEEPSEFRTASGRDLLSRTASLSVGPPSATAATGPGYLELAGGILGAARSILDYLNFGEMKKRSGVIGEVGLSATIKKIKTQRPGLRVQLAGHSLGARLISGAARALPAGPPVSIASMTLLQAAFSHYSFSNDWDAGTAGNQVGYYRPDVVGHRFSGPMLITYTANDLVLSIFYAFASGYAHEVARLAVGGGPTDIYGALGRNGALRTPEAVAARLLSPGSPYAWQAGRPHNLLADDFISGHTDWTNQAVAYAMLSAIATT
jgi:hypothetical protein